MFKLTNFERTVSGAGDQKWARGEVKYDGIPVL